MGLRRAVSLRVPMGLQRCCGMLSRKGLWVLLAGGVALAGCAHAAARSAAQPVEVPRAPLPQEVRARIGTVAVVAAGPIPVVEVQGVPRYSTAGAAAGLAKGFTLGVLGAAACFLTMGRLPEACGLALATPVLMIKSAKEDAEKWADPPVPDAGELSLRDVARGARVQGILRDRLLTAAQEQAGRVLVPLPAEDPPSFPRVTWRRRSSARCSWATTGGDRGSGRVEGLPA